MKNSEITVAVNCKLSVSRDTAEGALKLVEMFLNSNSDYKLMQGENDDGTTRLYLVSYAEVD